MSQPKALVAGIHHWHSPFRVGTHYITEFLLAQGFEVAHISAPITPLHRLMPTDGDIERRRENHKCGGEDEAGSGLWHYVPYALVAPDNRPLLSSKAVVKHWHRLTYPSLLSAIKRRGFDSVDLLFLDTVYQPFWLDAIKYQRCGYRLADYTAGFSGFSRAFADIEREIISRIDRVFCASTGLLDYATKYGCRQPVLLPNGIDLAKFQSVGASEFESVNSSGPIAVYVGAFKEWFDHEAILALAKAAPELTIVLAGPSEHIAARYKAVSNVHLLGPVSASDVPALLKCADVGLIPFDVDASPELINNVNPLKLYEYFAAGLPVVATEWRELKRLNSPAMLARGRVEFVEGVIAVLDGEANGVAERAFVQNIDWSITLRPLGEFAAGD